MKNEGYQPLRISNSAVHQVRAEQVAYRQALYSQLCSQVLGSNMQFYRLMCSLSHLGSNLFLKPQEKDVGDPVSMSVGLLSYRLAEWEHRRQAGFQLPVPPVVGLTSLLQLPELTPAERDHVVEYIGGFDYQGLQTMLTEEISDGAVADAERVFLAAFVQANAIHHGVDMTYPVLLVASGIRKGVDLARKREANA